MAAGKCPFCLWVIAADEESITCEHCSTAYHSECWAENSGCATFGCVAWAQMPPGVAPTQVAALDPRPLENRPPASASLSGGSVDILVRQFCDQCGTRVTPADRFCGTCGSRLED